MANLICGVYEIRNVVNDHKYIGSSIDIRKRFHDHKTSANRNKHHSIYLQRAWNMYKGSNFVFTLLFRCDPQNAIYYEDLCIKKLKPEYNICPNAFSSLGVKRSDEYKRKISIASTGHKMSENERKNLSKLLMGNKRALGYKRSDEAIRKSSEANKGNKYNIGRKHTEEAKRNMSNATKLWWNKRKNLQINQGVLLWQ